MCVRGVGWGPGRVSPLTRWGSILPSYGSSSARDLLELQILYSTWRTHYQTTPLLKEQQTSLQLSQAHCQTKPILRTPQQTCTPCTQPSATVLQLGPEPSRKTRTLPGLENYNPEVLVWVYLLNLLHVWIQFRSSLTPN